MFTVISIKCGVQVLLLKGSQLGAFCPLPTVTLNLNFAILKPEIVFN